MDPNCLDEQEGGKERKKKKKEFVTGAFKREKQC